MGDRCTVHGDGELGVGSGQSFRDAALAKLPHGLRDSVVGRVRPHLGLMLDVVGIGEGDDTAARAYGASIGEYKAK